MRRRRPTKAEREEARAAGGDPETLAARTRARFLEQQLQLFVQGVEDAVSFVPDDCREFCVRAGAPGSRATVTPERIDGAVGHLVRLRAAALAGQDKDGAGPAAASPGGAGRGGRVRKR
jgi:hypothetical protein